MESRVSLESRLKEARERREKKIDTKKKIENGQVAAKEVEESRLGKGKETDSASKEKSTKYSSKFKIKKPKTKSLALATKQLSSMVRTGLSIVEALNLVADTSDDKNIKMTFKEVAEGIKRGNGIVEMMERYPVVFDDMYIALTDAGEQAGLLAEVLEREAKLLETLAKLKSQIGSAMAYPIAILVLVIVVVAVMLIFVIPVFAGIYEQNDAALPFITQLLVDASDFLRSPVNLVLVIAGLAVCWVAGKRLIKQDTVSRAIDKGLLKMPVVGDLVTKANLANFSRTLASLSAAGVSLLEAITISRRTLSNSVFKDVIDEMYQSILVGDRIYEVLENSECIPQMFSAMFRIGEQTGELGNMIDKLADFYEDEVSTSVKALTSVLEPMMIVVVAGIVGVILAAMYLPMFSMLQNMK